MALPLRFAPGAACAASKIIILIILSNPLAFGDVLLVFPPDLPIKKAPLRGAFLIGSPK
jgi:hypothetical protein